MYKITCVFSYLCADIQGRGNSEDQIASVGYTK